MLPIARYITVLEGGKTAACFKGACDKCLYSLSIVARWHANRRARTISERAVTLDRETGEAEQGEGRGETFVFFSSCTFHFNSGCLQKLDKSRPTIIGKRVRGLAEAR